MRSPNYLLLPRLALVATLLAFALTASADPGSKAPNAGRRFKLLGFNLELGPRVPVGAGVRAEQAYLFEIRPRVSASRRSEPVSKGRLARLARTSVEDGGPFGAEAIERVVALEAARLRAQMSRAATRTDELVRRPIEDGDPVSLPASIFVTKRARPAVCAAEVPEHTFAAESRETMTPYEVRAGKGPVPTALDQNC